MPTPVDPLDAAARALRYRDRSRQQLDARLAKAGVAEDARADALDTLERVGYVNDERFALNRAESLAGRGYGNEAIRAFLEQEGAGPEAVEQALAGLEPEAVRVQGLVARHGATARLAAQLQRKGFGPEALEPAFAEVFAEGEPGA